MMRYEFNAWNNTVNLWCADELIDSMMFIQYRALFGRTAANKLMAGR